VGKANGSGLWPARWRAPRAHRQGQNRVGGHASLCPPYDDASIWPGTAL